MVFKDCVLASLSRSGSLEDLWLLHWNWKDNGRIASLIQKTFFLKKNIVTNDVYKYRSDIFPKVLWKYQSSWMAIHLLQFAKRLAVNVDWNDPQFCDNRLLLRFQTNFRVHQSHCGHNCGYHNCSTFRCVFSCRDNL